MPYRVGHLPDMSGRQDDGTCASIGLRLLPRRRRFNIPAAYRAPAPMILIPITHTLLATTPVAGSAFLRALCESNLANYPAAGAKPPWMAYLAEESGSCVGACAFKAPPDDDGVEIAYFTFPENEGQGVATRMAAALIAIAAEHGVQAVRASSLPDNRASGRVLDKLGFERVGSLKHPEAGELWAWRRAAARTAAGEHP